MSQRTNVLTAVLLSSLILVGAGCNSTTTVAVETPSQPNTPPAPDQKMPAMEPKAPPALTAEQEAQLKIGGEVHEPTTLTFNVTAGAFYYAPNEIRVKKGDKVRIILTGVDMMHNLYIDELGVKSDTVKPGESVTIEFTADTIGTFEYYCAVGQHRKMGQIGKLIVE